MGKDLDSYIDFLVSIKPLCNGRSVIKSDVKIDGMHVYDTHLRVCCSIKGFMFAAIEEGWVAFIWDDEVYTYPCSVTDILLTDTHRKSNLN